MANQTITFAFLTLSAAAFYSLWIFMIQNGSFDALNVAVADGQFANGTPLKTIYTGVPPIDAFLTTLVAFTYEVTSGQDTGAWLLMVDITSTLQTSLLWVLADSLRDGRTQIWVILPAVWGLGWNYLGAALILPLYLFLRTRRSPTPKPGMQLMHASALPSALILGGYIPALAMLSAPLFPRSPGTHQKIVALVQLSPVLVTLLQYLIAGLLPNEISRKAQHLHAGRKTLPPYALALRQAYLLAAFISVTGHLYVLQRIFRSPGLFQSIYIPAANQTVMTSGTDLMLQGALLFLQYDFIIINLSSLLWAYFLLEQTAAFSVQNFGGVVLTNAILGPGAMVTGLLWWNEGLAIEGKKA